MLLIILFLKFMVEAYFEKINPSFGHNTGVVVIIGIICSWFIFFQASRSGDVTLMTSLRFDKNLFFNLILPLIVFPSGYNMRRKKFFRNLATIMKFGFIGTLICFAIYTAALYGVWKAGFLTKIQHSTGENVPIELTMFQILSVCSLLCSSDVIAAISMISYTDQPKLFSIVYGEGVFNDIVSIILFNTVQGLQNETFTSSTPFIIIGNFILLAIFSLLIGIAFGVFSSLLFKHFRALAHSAVTETCVLFIIALACYYCSEAAEQSGMISLLVSGITMAHYTWYNLSPQGKTISSVSFSIFGAAAEAFVFAYIGLCTFTYANDSNLDG
jgi:NhaP-type Na+/H+ or K+/H+ antiporter